MLSVIFLYFIFFIFYGKQAMSLESTSSEESTTSSREGPEEDWYREAVSSSSSEDGEKHVICTKNRNKSHQPALPVNESFIYYAINLNTSNLIF